jgi:hypothetical protein
MGGVACAGGGAGAGGFDKGFGEWWTEKTLHPPLPKSLIINVFQKWGGSRSVSSTYAR